MNNEINKKIVSCNRDCTYFDFKGDIPCCTLRQMPVDNETRDTMPDEVTDCCDYKKIHE